MKRLVLVVAGFVAVSVGAAGATIFPLWNPWTAFVDHQLPDTLPCGSAENTHTAQFSSDHDAERGTVGHVFFLCHDGRQFVREFVDNSSGEGDPGLPPPGSGTPKGYQFFPPQTQARPGPPNPCKPGTVPGKNGYCVPMGR